MWKNCLSIAPVILTESLVHEELRKISSIFPSVFATHIPASANSCCKSWNEFYFTDRSGQVKQFTAIISQWKIHACNESQRSWQLLCHISLIQICNTTWDKAGDMPSVVTAIIAAGRNWTIDYNACQACNVVIKVLTCIKTACDRVRACSHDPGTTHCPGATHWTRGQLCLGARSDACNCSHKFFVAPGQLQEAGYPSNTG